MQRADRELLTATENGTQGSSEAVSNPSVPDALSKAIDTADGARLRLLVKDTGAEDNQDDEDESNEEEDEENSDENGAVDNGKQKKRKQISGTGQEMRSRLEMCLNCEAKFDVTANYMGGCQWHPGTRSCFQIEALYANILEGQKEVDYYSDFWADHDENCHGTFESLIDDAEFAEGFTWSCCERLGDDKGCKSTKHKAEVIVPLAINKKRRTGVR